MDSQPSPQLAQVVAMVRDRISKLRGDKNFNEQNTKASLIVPILQALGWDTNDADEVHWEYKPKPRHNPVDFALLLKRTPCLFIEAKALRESLADDKLVVQILSYASVAGVQWVVLANGDEYRIYNANAPVPVEGKLFRTVSIANDPSSSVLGTLSLLSKANLQDKKIGRLWESYFVDRQVKLALEELLNPAEPARAVVRVIRKLADGKLRESDVRASLRRARLQVDFPEEPEAEVPVSGAGRKPPRRRRAGVPSDDAKAKSEVTVAALIAEGILKAPAEVISRYRKHDLRATVETDGSVVFAGKRYESLSKAGGMARRPFHRGDLRGKPYPQTNGWIFWQIRDDETGKLVPVDVLRERYLERKRGEARRFTERQV